MAAPLEIIKKIALLLIGAVLGVFLAESIFYLSPQLKRRYSFERFVNYSPMIKNVLNVTPNFYRPSSIVGYERIPNSKLNINSYGLLGKEFDIYKKDNVFRILVLGDSLAEQNFFIEFLKEQLNSLNIGKEFEIINAGVGGYNIWQYAQFLKYKGIKFSPDMVIVSFCLNDLSSDSNVFCKTKEGFMEFSLDENKHSPGRKIVPFIFYLFKHSYLYRFFITVVSNYPKVNFSVPEELNKKMNDKVRLKEGLYYMGQIKNISQENKITLLCFIWPYFMPYQEYSLLQRDEYSDIKTLLNYLNINYIDLDSYFPDKTRRSLRVHQEDFIHPIEEAHKVVAGILFKHICDNYYKLLLPKNEANK